MRPPSTPPPADLTTDAITALRAAFSALVPPPATTLPASGLVALLTATGEPPPATAALAAALARAVADDGPSPPPPPPPPQLPSSDGVGGDTRQEGGRGGEATGTPPSPLGHAGVPGSPGGGWEGEATAPGAAPAGGDRTVGGGDSGGGGGGGGGGSGDDPPVEPPSQGTPTVASPPAAAPRSTPPPTASPKGGGDAPPSPSDGGRGGMATVAMLGAPPDVAATARSRWADWARRAPPPLAAPPPEDATAWPPASGAIEVHTHTPAGGGPADAVHVCRLHRACVRRVDGAVVLPAWAAAHAAALAAACGLRAVDAAAAVGGGGAAAAAQGGGGGAVLFSDDAHRQCAVVPAWGDGRGNGGGMDLFGPPGGLPTAASALLPALLPLAVGLDGVLGPPGARGNGTRSRRCLFPSSPAVAAAAGPAGAPPTGADGGGAAPVTGRWLASVLSRQAAAAAAPAAVAAAADPVGPGSPCPDRTHPSRVNVAVVLPPRLRGVHAHHWARATVRLLPRRPAGPHTLFWADAVAAGGGAAAIAPDAAVAFRSVVTTSAAAAVPPPALLYAPNVVWAGVGLDRRPRDTAARSRRGQLCHLTILLLDRRASAGGTAPPAGGAAAAAVDVSSVVNLGALRRALDEAVPAPLFAPYRLARVTLRTAHPEATAFEELVDGVQVADALLLADGAGAAALSWARPGTPVVSLAPFGHYAGTWFAAARSLGLRPRRVVCAPDPPAVAACFAADRSMDAAAAAVAAADWRAAAAAAASAAAAGGTPQWGGGGVGAGAGGGPPVRVEGDVANAVTRRRTLPAERACVRSQRLLVDAAALARALLADAVGSCYDPRRWDTPVG